MILVTHEATVGQTGFPGCRFVESGVTLFIIGKPTEPIPNIDLGKYPAIDLGDDEAVMAIFPLSVVKMVQVVEDPKQEQPRVFVPGRNRPH